jgi:hypothetical protein
MKESVVEQRVSKKLQKAGWLSVKCMQMSMNGWPDRQYLKEPGRMVLVEWKRAAYINDKGKLIPREEPDELQLLRHRQLREMGFEVIVAWSEKEVQHLLDEPRERF